MLSPLMAAVRSSSSVNMASNMTQCHVDDGNTPCDLDSQVRRRDGVSLGLRREHWKTTSGVSQEPMCGTFISMCAPR